ncbi:phage tail protein [Pectobacterium aroidearum]|uniref:phage tail protein n=1 Tax=Pectobacterium aroidearum TaxID=1201031 RepID=UPI0030183C57
MSAKYLALLTNIGAAKLANATALGSSLNITRMAVGDGGGTLPTPNPAQTMLINEQRRAALNSLSVDPKNPSQIIAEQVIPENEGGWWIREIGLFDDEGNLIAVANCPETYKPQLQEGSGRIQTVRMILIVSSTDAVTLKIDPAVVLATRGYVDDAINAHEKSRKHPDGTLNAKGFVQLSSATNSDSELLAATPKAVKAAVTAANNAATAAANANTNANGRVPSGRKVNGKELAADIVLTAADVGAYTKAETDTRVATATTAANNAATAATNANTNANGRVPSGRKVNGKALTADIALTAADVGAYTKAETDTRVATATTAANNAATAAANANTNANGRVPSGRKVNGKELTADIVLGAGDVGAYTKAETDTRVTAATTAANNAATAAANANTNANGRVPSGRTVNGKALSADIVLGAGDVGAYTKAETDTRVAAVTTAANNAATAATNANTNANGRVPSGRTVNGKALSADITLGAGDVGALTDTQAAQKYALRSIKINGKPLSADVNLLAGDIDTWNKTESDGRFLMKSATAAAATKLATPRKISGVIFDGTSDINLNLGITMKAFGQYSPMNAIGVEFTAVNANTLRCYITRQDQGFYVELGVTKMVLVDATLTDVISAPYVRRRFIGSFPVTKITMDVGMNASNGMWEINYPNHGIAAGSKKSFYIMGLVYREVGMRAIGQVAEIDGLSYQMNVELDSPVSNIRAPIISYAESEIDSYIGLPIQLYDRKNFANQRFGALAHTEFLDNRHLSICVSDNNTDGIINTPMVTVMVYDL